MEKQAQISGPRFVLSVQDLEKSAAFYIEKLGFESVWLGPGWHFVKRDTCFIMLGKSPDKVSARETSTHSYFAYLMVENIDLFYQDFLDKKVEIAMPIASRPWGIREFGIRTIDGHRIMFGEEGYPTLDS